MDESNANESYIYTHDFNSDSPFSIRIVKEISDIIGTSPMDLDPLYQSIDPDILDSLPELCHDEAQPLYLEFSHSEYKIDASSDGVFIISEQNQSSAKITVSDLEHFEKRSRNERDEDPSSAFTTYHDFTSTELIEETLVTAIENVKNSDPTRISPLSNSIDPEILESIFVQNSRYSGPPPHCIRFTHEGCELAINRSGTIVAFEKERNKSSATSVFQNLPDICSPMSIIQRISKAGAPLATPRG